MLKTIGNLNYFLALVLAGSIVAIGWISPPIKRLFLHPGKIDPIYYSINYIAIAVVICLVSTAWWLKKSIVPAPITSKAKWVLIVGSVAMAIGNGAIVLALMVNIIGFSEYPEFAHYYIAAALMLAFPSNIVGIICVEASRLLNRLPSSRPQL